MNLFGDLKKAFDLMWMATNKLAACLDASERTLVEQRLRALRIDFRSAEAAGDQAGMLRLAREMAALGGDLMACCKEAAY